jgi:hypothetical protein
VHAIRNFAVRQPRVRIVIPLAARDGDDLVPARREVEW